MAEQMEKAAAGQITAEAAAVYENFFVPALFGQFAPWLVELSGAGPGGKVLDVATGTGVVARVAAATGARVTAVDINEGMLTFARRYAREVDFQPAAAENLPFDDGQFDAVLCQFGLMFFVDRPRALAEMARVCKPGGKVAVAVFEAWEKSPGYCDLIPLVGEVVGNDGAEALKAPFCLGEGEAFEEALDKGGLPHVQISRKVGMIRHASLNDWLDTEIGGWTLASMVDAPMMETLKERARERLAGYVGADGSVSFEAPALFAVSTIEA